MILKAENISKIYSKRRVVNDISIKLKRGETYTDFKTRCNAELDRNKKFFQPKEWSVEKLLYNYDLLFHSVNNSAILYETLIEALHDHIKGLYEDYNVEPRHKLPNSILHAQKRSFYIEK